MLKKLLGLGGDELARIEIPGDTTVELEAGTVKLRYEQRRESSQKVAYGAPELEIAITPAGGGESRSPCGRRGCRAARAAASC